MKQEIKKVVDLYIKKWNYETIIKTMDALFIIALGYLLVVTILSLFSKVPFIVIIISLLGLVLIFAIKKRAKSYVEKIDNEINGGKLGKI